MSEETKMDVDEGAGAPAQRTVAQCRAVVADEKAPYKEREAAIFELGRLYAEGGEPENMKELLVEIRPFFATIPKVRTARIVRGLIDLVATVPDSLALQAAMCRESIIWCTAEKRTFLRLRVSARLSTVLLELGDYKEALRVINGAVRAVKKIDDKQLLVEIHLIESRVHLRLRNVPKSKGALTAARAAANAIYCPPTLQGAIDEQAAVLCMEEGDFKTASSYFFESFETFNTLKSADRAVASLKYMLLCKIMTDNSNDVYSLINGRVGLAYKGREIDAMRALADAHKARSIHAYAKLREEYGDQLVEDAVVEPQLKLLYDRLLDQNLLKVVEPFSRVQIDHVARLIDLPVEVTVAKLSQMILDGKLNGILDQGSGDLIVFDEEEQDKTFDAALETIKELGFVVDKLHARAKILR